MRRILGGTVMAIGLWCVPSPLPAQQAGSCANGATHAARMQEPMGELDQRLEQKLAEVDRTKGDKKVAAMAEVIRELLAQRRRMHEGMGGAHAMAGECPRMPGAGRAGSAMPEHGPGQGKPCPMRATADSGNGR